MARRYAYWVNYQFNTSRGSGEGSQEFIVTGPLTHGDQVLRLSHYINDTNYGGKASVVVRTFQLLREE